MNDKLYSLIEQHVSSGEVLEAIPGRLVILGWPADEVNETFDLWMQKNGRKHQKTSYKTWLHGYSKKAMPAVVVVVILNTISSAIALLRPWPTKILADSVFGRVVAPGPLAQYTGKSSLILIVSGMTLGLFLIGTIFAFIKDFILLKIGYWLNLSIKEESFRHILHLPLFHKERLSKGDYVHRQNVVTNSLSDLVLGTTSTICESIIMVLGVFVIMFSMNKKLTLVTVVVTPFLYGVIRLLGPPLGVVSKKITQLQSRTASHITESIDNTETLQAFNLEEMQVERLSKLWQESYGLAKKSMLWGKLFNFSNGLLIVLGTSTVMYLGGNDVLNGTGMSLGKLLIFMTYMGYLLGPIQSIAEQLTSRKQKLLEVSRIYDVLSDHEGVEYERNDVPFPEKVAGRVEFRHLTYVYGDKVVLNDVNLVIEPGTKIGIIGPSGGGKSTLLKLLPLFIEPTRGRCMVDGVDIQSVSLHDLRGKIAWVSQTPQLFSDSIKNNVLYGDIDRQITSTEFADAISSANVSEFIPGLPMGINTPAGEGGSTLSGGQRQRISIARALLKNAPIICMDEPTSALDNKSEQFITESIGGLIKNKTVLLVTHRKSLLMLMDKVYVLEGGVLRDVEIYGGYEKYMHYLQVHEQI
jgi:ATP-binding cassette, subfamily B, bacterial